MRLTLTRTGGFGGIRQVLALDADQLTRDERTELRQRVAAAGFWSLPTRFTAAAPAPDRLRYRLVVEDGDRRHEVLAAEEATPEPLLALIRWVEACAHPTSDAEP